MAVALPLAACMAALDAAPETEFGSDDLLCASHLFSVIESQGLCNFKQDDDTPWLPVETRALCNFCKSASNVQVLLTVVRAWDARIISELTSLRQSFERFRQVEKCSGILGIQYCGALVDLQFVIQTWLLSGWTVPRWQQRVLQVDPSARRPATSVYAWWRVLSAWHTRPCRTAERVHFEQHCLARNFHDALEAAKATYDWDLAAEVFATIAALGGEAAAVLQWPHMHKAHAYYVPALAAAPAVWRPKDGGNLGLFAGVLESYADVVLEEWLHFRLSPWAHSEEHVDLTQYVWNASGGSWFRWKFYTTSQGWNHTLCARMAALCGALENNLPGARNGITSAYEEVSISELPPGAHIGVHSGSPMRVNFHMGLTGLSAGSYLGIVHPGPRIEYKVWHVGKVTAIFDDSYDHFVQVDAAGSEPRAILHVGVCHPSVLRWHGLY